MTVYSASNAYDNVSAFAYMCHALVTEFKIEKDSCNPLYVLILVSVLLNDIGAGSSDNADAV